MARILTVDDAAFMRKVIKDTLTKAGYSEIYEAEDGAMAVEKYNELKPDLVLMDITMPEMDGIETFRRMKEDYLIETPVIFLTASGDEDDVLNAISLGAVNYLKKPFRPQELLKRVAMGLERK